jgi:hypothetical protein
MLKELLRSDNSSFGQTVFAIANDLLTDGFDGSLRSCGRKSQGLSKNG